MATNARSAVPSGALSLLSEDAGFVRVATPGTPVVWSYAAASMEVTSVSFAGHRSPVTGVAGASAGLPMVVSCAGREVMAWNDNTALLLWKVEVPGVVTAFTFVDRVLVVTYDSGHAVEEQDASSGSVARTVALFNAVSGEALPLPTSMDSLACVANFLPFSNADMWDRPGSGLHADAHGRGRCCRSQCSCCSHLPLGLLVICSAAGGVQLWECCTGDTTQSWRLVAARAAPALTPLQAWRGRNRAGQYSFSSAERSPHHELVVNALYAMQRDQRHATVPDWEVRSGEAALFESTKLAGDAARNIEEPRYGQKVATFQHPGCTDGMKNAPYPLSKLELAYVPARATTLEDVSCDPSLVLASVSRSVVAAMGSGFLAVRTAHSVLVWDVCGLVEAHQGDGIASVPLSSWCVFDSRRVHLWPLATPPTIAIVSGVLVTGGHTGRVAAWKLADEPLEVLVRNVSPPATPESKGEVDADTNKGARGATGAKDLNSDSDNGSFSDGFSGSDDDSFCNGDSDSDNGATPRQPLSDEVTPIRDIHARLWATDEHTGHTCPVDHLVVCHSKGVVLSAGVDGFVRAWDFSSVASPQAHVEAGWWRAGPSAVIGVHVTSEREPRVIVLYASQHMRVLRAACGTPLHALRCGSDASATMHVCDQPSSRSVVPHLLQRNGTVQVVAERRAVGALELLELHDLTQRVHSKWLSRDEDAHVDEVTAICTSDDHVFSASGRFVRCFARVDLPPHAAGELVWTACGVDTHADSIVGLVTTTVLVPAAAVGGGAAAAASSSAPAGQPTAMVEEVIVVSYSSSSVRAWSGTTGSLEWWAAGAGDGAAFAVVSGATGTQSLIVCASTDGSRLVGRVAVDGSEAWRCRMPLGVTSSHPIGVALADGYLAMCTGNVVALVDCNDGKVLASCTLQDDFDACQAGWSRQAQVLVVRSDDGRVASVRITLPGSSAAPDVMRRAECDEMALWNQSTSYVQLAVSGNHVYLVGSGGDVLVFDLRDGKLLQHTGPKLQGCRAIALFPKSLVATTLAGLVVMDRWWLLRTGGEIFHVPAKETGLDYLLAVHKPRISFIQEIGAYARCNGSVVGFSLEFCPGCSGRHCRSDATRQVCLHTERARAYRRGIGGGLNVDVVWAAVYLLHDSSDCRVRFDLRRCGPYLRGREGGACSSAAPRQVQVLHDVAVRVQCSRHRHPYSVPASDRGPH